MTKTLLLVSLLLIVSGCETYRASKAVAVERGAEVADTAVKDAIWVLCWGTSVGSIRREFTAAPARWQAYLALCNESTDVMLELKLEEVP